MHLKFQISRKFRKRILFNNFFLKKNFMAPLIEVANFKNNCKFQKNVFM